MKTENDDSKVGDHLTFIEKLYVEQLTEFSTTRVENPTEYIEKIYIEDYPRLLSLALKKRCTREEAEDIVSQAFCNYITFLENHRWEETINKPFSFLAKIVDNLIFDKYRREKAKGTVSLDDEENSFEPSDKGNSVSRMHLDLDDKEFFAKKMHIHMDGFTRYEMKLLWLGFIEKCKPRQIARLLGQSYEKTAIDYNKAKAKLRARVKAKVRRK